MKYVIESRCGVRFSEIAPGRGHTTTVDWDKADEIVAILDNLSMPCLPGKAILGAEPVTVVILPEKDHEQVVSFRVQTKKRVAGWNQRAKDIALDISVSLPQDEHHTVNPKDPTHLMRQVVVNLFSTQIGESRIATLMFYEGCPYQFDGKCWRRKTRDEIWRAVWKQIEQIFAAHNERSDKPVSISGGLVDDVLSSLEANLTTRKRLGEWLNDDPRDPSNLLVCENGIVDLDRYVNGLPSYLLPHDINLFVAHTLPWPFDPLAQKPARFFQFLDELWSDKDCHLLLQEILGYILTSPWLHIFIVFIGATRGGKSTLGKLMSLLVGKDNVAALQLHRLADRFALSGAVGKRLLMMSEARWPDRGSPAIENLKSISSRDPIQVDAKYQKPITTSDWGTPVITSNQPPTFADDSDSVVVRMVLLQFLESFAGKEDHKLLEKLEAELPGIVLWAVEGWHRLRKNGGYFTVPGGSAALIESISADASPIKEWGGECCAFGDGTKASKLELYESYVHWCSTHAVAPPKDRVTFNSQLVAAYPKLKSDRIRAGEERVRVFRGIALKTEKSIVEQEAA